MSELEIYGGIVIAGIAISGTVGPGIVAVHHKLEREVGDMPRWADVLALVGGVGFGVALAVAAGAILGWRAEALDPYIGGVWGLVGGVIGPSMWGSVRGLALDTLRRRVGGE